MLLLEHGNCLIPAHAYDSADRHSRHALFYELSGADSERVQHRLAASRVVLLGCGGIGSLMAVTLATSGVGELTLVDGDHVELSNLTHQFLLEGRTGGTFLEKNEEVDDYRQVLASLMRSALSENESLKTLKTLLKGV